MASMAPLTALAAHAAGADCPMSGLPGLHIFKDLVLDMEVSFALSGVAPVNGFFNRLKKVIGLGFDVIWFFFRFKVKVVHVQGCRVDADKVGIFPIKVAVGDSFN